MKTRGAATPRRISREDGGSSRERHMTKPGRKGRGPPEAGRRTVASEPVEGNLASTVIWDTGF